MTYLASPLAFPNLSAAIVPFVAGLVLVLALIWAVWRGIRLRRSEPGPPAPGEQPKLPETGPVREVQETRAPDEMPRAAEPGERLTPHQLKQHGNTGTRRSDDQTRRR